MPTKKMTYTITQICSIFPSVAGWHCANLFNGHIIFSSHFLKREGPPRDFGEQGKKTVYSGEQGQEIPKINGTWERRQFRGPENMESQDFDFGE